MAVVPKLKPEEIDELGDITRNLTSLQFQSALTDEEKSLLHLRKRSHAHTVTICAQATYYVTILNEARQIAVQLKNPKVRRATRLIQDDPTRDYLHVGIIGCGRLGSHLAHCLLSFAEVNPENLFISTRRPETLIELQDKGVTCISSNVDVASRVHILFLCVLPSQFATVAEDIKTHIQKGCIVYSLISAVPIPRLKQLLSYSNVLRPEYQWGTGDEPWDHTLEVTAAFCRPEILQLTCPLSLNKKDCVVATSDKLAEQLVYALANMCTQLELGCADTVDVLNAVILGHTGEKPLQETLRHDDITRFRNKDSIYFPYFDLTTTLNRDTPITKKLVKTEVVRKAYVERYCYMFQQYIDWRNTALAQAYKQVSFSAG